MTNILFTISILLLSLPAVYGVTYTGPTSLSNIIDNDELQITGPSKLKKVKTSYLNITGPLEFSDLEVTGYAQILGPILNSRNGKFKQLSVIGPIDAETVSAEEIAVTGPVNIVNLDVLGSMDIIGPTKIINARLQNLEVTSRQVVLDNVNIKNITIKEDRTSYKTQTLVLQGKSTIYGDIHFISGKGVITINGSNVKILGKITGAITK